MIRANTKWKTLIWLLAAAMLLSLVPIDAFAGGGGFAELDITLRDKETPGQSALLLKDFSGSFIFENEEGDTIEIGIADFRESNGNLNSFVSFLGEAQSVDDDRSSYYLVQKGGLYTLVSYPKLSGGYQFVMPDTPPTFYLYQEDIDAPTVMGYAGTDYITLEVDRNPGSNGAAPAAATAKPTSSAVLVNGANIAFDAYNINDNNYFKLRDLAFILSGTEKQFEVGWDGAANAIALTSGKAYTAVSGEMEGKGAGNKSASPTNSKIYLDGEAIALTAYNINNNNYFKLRDIGQAFDFGVTWDGTKNTIVVDTSVGYTPEG
jgi:hypothetical protein